MSESQQAARLRMQQRMLWEQGQFVSAETLLAENQQLAAQPELAVELIYHEVMLREARGERPEPAEYLARFPEYAGLLQSLFEVHAALAEHPGAYLPAASDVVLAESGTAGAVARVHGTAWVSSGNASPEGAGISHGPHVADSASGKQPGHAQAAGYDQQALQSGCKPSEVPGTIGRYQVLGPLGSGAFGMVWLGYDPQLDRQVAIKVPHAGRAGGRETGEVFLREMRRAAGLRHPGIVTVYDVVAGPDAAYMVSEYVPGVDLARRLAAGRPSAAEAAAWVAQAAEALHAAHEQGLIHRDIKPGNILVDADGQVRITDFGLAFSMHGEVPTAGWAGTPQYMAPEQIMPEGGPVDRRSDIFSLGLVFYELLTGRLPYTATSWGELLARVEEQIVAPPRWFEPRVPRRLERICMKALAWDARQRYQTAQAFAEDLKAYLAWTAAHAGGPSLGEPSLTAERVQDAAGQRRVAAGWLWAGMAASLALLVWLGMAMINGVVPDRAPPEGRRPPQNPVVGHVPPCELETARLLAADLAVLAQALAAEAVEICQQAPYQAIPQFARRAAGLQQAVQRAAAQPSSWLALAAEARTLEGLAAQHGAADLPALAAWRQTLDALAALDLGSPDHGEVWLPSDTVLVVSTARLRPGRVASLGPNCLAMGADEAHHPILDERTVAMVLGLPLINERPSPDAAEAPPRSAGTMAITLDNTRNPYPFACLVAGREVRIAPGQFEVVPAVGPVELVFDPGRPGPLIHKRLAPGTYRIGVRSDTPAWDVFNGPGP